MNRIDLDRGIRVQVDRQFAAPGRHLEVFRISAIWSDGRHLATADRVPIRHSLGNYFHEVVAGRQVRNRVGTIDDIDRLGNATGCVIVTGHADLEIRPTRNIRYRTTNRAGLALRR